MMWFIKAFISFWLGVVALLWGAVMLGDADSLLISILSIVLLFYAAYTSLRFVIWLVSKIINLTKEELENG
ncbi:MAG: hypothetical protein GYB18_02050 [Oceanospirillales bacterium]|nr:hypothetical protein [Oceanospirillales bacterium]